MEKTKFKPIPMRELTGTPDPDQAKEPGYDEWLEKQVRQAIREGKKNPDSYIPAEQVWKDLEIED